MRRCTIISNQEETHDKPTVSKLMIDEPSDFRFHAAYEAYSKIWVLDPPYEVKKELNAMISLLSEKKLSYKDFYLKIGKYRREFTPDHRPRGRRRIQTQRKRDWRRKEARKKRNSRYKKRRPTAAH